MRQRPAPSAARSDSSFSRAAARASCRFATFAQAMSSTTATNANTVTSTGWIAPTTSCLSGMMITPWPASLVGYSFARPATTPLRSACACASDTPRLSRATLHTRKRFPVGSTRVVRLAPGAEVTGSQTSSAPPIGSRKSAAVTPITTCGLPFRMSVRPTMFGSEPKRVAHTACESTATAAPLPSPSSGVNKRPRSARAPSTVSAFALTKLPTSRSGASTPVRFTLCERTMDNSSKLRLRVRHSTMLRQRDERARLGRHRPPDHH